MSIPVRRPLVLSLLLGLAIAAVIGGGWDRQQPAWLTLLVAFALAVGPYALGPWIIERTCGIRWVDSRHLGPEFALWYRACCAEKQIPAPRLGIIEDHRPNAFTYGHRLRSSRVVVTSGLLETLTPTEILTVLSHELGRLANRDLVLTVASPVSLALTLGVVAPRAGLHGGGQVDGARRTPPTEQTSYGAIHA